MLLGYSFGVGVVMLVVGIVVGLRHMRCRDWGTCIWGSVLGWGVGSGVEVGLWCGSGVSVY